MMDINATIVEMFWCDYTAKWGNHVSGRGPAQILRDFLAWLDQRTTGGQMRDLRLIRNQTARAAVDRIMGVRDDE
jgi:hypothetical protein